MKSFAVTAFGRTALEGELNHRIRVDRPALAERLQKTVGEETDLAENAEYHRALEDQVANEKRILELEDNLAGLKWWINSREMSSSLVQPSHWSMKTPDEKTFGRSSAKRRRMLTVVGYQLTRQLRRL